MRIATLWTLPLLIGPPLYSRDVYSYAALGRMVNLGFDPYYYGPAVLGGGSDYLQGVGGAWLHTSTPYGPLFLGAASAIVRFAGNSVFNAILMLRLVEVVGLVLIAVGLPKLAIAAGKDPARAVWLGVCNPLDPMACEDGTGCYAVGDLFHCAPDASADGGAPGDPCEFINACDPGSFCGNAAGVPVSGSKTTTIP